MCGVVVEGVAGIVVGVSAEGFKAEFASRGEDAGGYFTSVL